MQALPRQPSSLAYPHSSFKHQKNRPAFTCLFGKNIAEDIIASEEKMLARDGFEFLSINVNKQNLTLNEIRQTIARRLSDGSHLRLHIHAANPTDWENDHHTLNINPSSIQPVETTRFLEEVLTMAKKLRRGQKKHQSPPIVHIQSCLAGVLSKEITPGSTLWKSAYFLVYSSKKVSSPDNYGAALNTAASYINYCAQYRERLDPMRLFYLTASRRGDCMRMLGGDLQGPLILHAPKKRLDLMNDEAPEHIQGAQKDIADFYLTAYETRRWEFNLGETPTAALADILQSSILHHNLKQAKKLLKQHPELVNSHSSVGRAAMNTAIMEESKKMVRLFIKKGVALDFVDDSGKGPTCAAVCAKNFKLLETLLAEGADPNEVDSEGNSALLFAVFLDHPEMVSVLLEHGADINFRLGDETVLLLAVNNANTAMVKLLLKHGAGPKAGLTRALIETASAAGQTVMAQILYKALESFPSED